MSDLWVIYDYDYGPYAISIHSTAEEAAVALGRKGYGRIGRWPIGMDFHDAIKAWEQQP